MKLIRACSRYAQSRRGRLVIGIAMLAIGVIAVAGASLYYALGRYGSTQARRLERLGARSRRPSGRRRRAAADTRRDYAGRQLQAHTDSHGRRRRVHRRWNLGREPARNGRARPGPRHLRGRLRAHGRAFRSIRAVRAGADLRSGGARTSPGVLARRPALQTAPTAEPSAASQPAAFARLDGGDLLHTYNAIYPGYRIHPKYWDRPWNAGADDYAYGAVKRPDGFVSVEASQGAPRADAPAASQIRIPSINVDSKIKTLDIIDIGDSREYETPKHIVGRIPNTSNPGELGNGWLFGHLESPIKGEGNVFQRLPEIPALLNTGDPVYVSLLNVDGDEFLYQITATNVVHQDDLALYDTEDASITLVACVPRLVYDHRLLVTGKLVGIKRAAG